MMNYKKGKNIEEELTKETVPFSMVNDSFLWMNVKGGTKLFNVIDFAKNAINNNEYRTMVWSGTGGGVSKTISCAEIMKRDFPLHQITQLNYQKVEEFWDPILDGLETIVVTRNIPCIHILLSLDPIDENTMGYQFSKNKTQFWADNVNNPVSTTDKTRNKFGENRSNNDNGAGGGGGGDGGGGAEGHSSKHKRSNQYDGNRYTGNDAKRNNMKNRGVGGRGDDGGETNNKSNRKFLQKNKTDQKKTFQQTNKATENINKKPTNPETTTSAAKS